MQGALLLVGFPGNCWSVRITHLRWECKSEHPCNLLKSGRNVDEVTQGVASHCPSHVGCGSASSSIRAPSLKADAKLTGLPRELLVSAHHTFAVSCKSEHPRTLLKSGRKVDGVALGVASQCASQVHQESAIRAGVHSLGQL